MPMNRSVEKSFEHKLWPKIENCMDLCIGLKLWIKIMNQHMSKDAVVLKNTIDLYTFMQFTQCIKRISLYNEASGR